MVFATINGITLHYQQEGASDVMPLVFINPLGCDLRIWDGVVPPLSQQANIVRHDMRGHGLSDCPPGPYTLGDFAGDLIGLLDHLHLERVILVGASVGGMIALQTAITFPQRMNALVLCDTAAKIGTADYWSERINTLHERGMAYLADTILARWFAPSFPEQHPAEYRGYYNLLTRMPLEGYMGTCAALGDADLRAEINQITVPALVLCGAEDSATTPELVQELTDSLPDARFELIAGAGHTPSVEQPTIVADAIAQFLKERIHG